MAGRTPAAAPAFDGTSALRNGLVEPVFYLASTLLDAKILDTV